MTIDVGDVVLDDVVDLEPGDQVVVDAVGPGLGWARDRRVSAHRRVGARRQVVGDSVMSGRFVVAGSGLGRATAVGEASYAKQIESQGRRFTRTCSEVMTGINTVLKRIGLLMVPVGLLTVVSEARHAGNNVSYGITNMVAPLVAMVPEGLVLLSSIAFAVSAIALARHHVLVNELPAVEGLARTDVVCTDKTGTLTEREPVFDRLEPIARMPAPGARRRRRDRRGRIRSLSGRWRRPIRLRTLPCVRSLLQFSRAEGWTAQAAVPFSSARKWSATDFGEHGAWVLGAPEIVLGSVRDSKRARDRLVPLQTQGARVVLLARSPSALRRGAPSDAAPASGAELPAELEAVAFVLLSERLRSDAAQTVRYLHEQGVGIRIISGDSPSTVSAIAGSAVSPAPRGRSTHGTSPTLRHWPTRWNTRRSSAASCPSRRRRWFARCSSRGIPSR